MLRPTLALMNRSLRFDVQRRRFHLLRLAVIGLLFCFLIWVHLQSRRLGAPGLLFFESIVWLNCLLITLAGASFFATAITEEKEELTLELFTIAGISPVAILLGKSTNRLIATLLVLIAQLPFMLLAITLGGTTYGQILSAFAALAAYLFLVANIALLCSVMCRRSGGAILYSSVTILLTQFASPLFSGIITQMVRRGVMPKQGWLFDACMYVAERLSAASIPLRINAIMDTGFQEPAFSFQVSSHLIVGAACFFASWMVFCVFNRGASLSIPSRKWLPQPGRMMRWLAPPRPWPNAVAWKDYHFVAGGRVMILFRLLLVPLLVFGLNFVQYVKGSRTNWWSITVFNVIQVSLFVIAAELAIQASRIFHDEIQYKTLSNLGMLPRHISWIAYAKIRGCLMGCIPSLLWLVMAIASEPTQVFQSVAKISDWVGIACGVCQFVLFLHVVAFTSLYIRWGSLVLGFLIYATYALICSSCLGVMLVGVIATQEQFGVSAMAFYNAVTAAIATAVLHFAIGDRLEVLKGA